MKLRKLIDIREQHTTPYSTPKVRGRRCSAALPAARCAAPWADSPPSCRTNVPFLLFSETPGLSFFEEPNMNRKETLIRLNSIENQQAAATHPALRLAVPPQHHVHKQSEQLIDVFMSVPNHLRIHMDISIISLICFLIFVFA